MSIIFKCEDEKNYYRFDMGSKFFALMIVKNGIVDIVNLVKFEENENKFQNKLKLEKQNFDFLSYMNYHIRIIVNDDIDIYYSKEQNNKFIKIISTPNNLLQTGLVGFGTFHKFIEISEFSITPPEFYNQNLKWEKNLIYV